jgi:hypothetical protein
MDKDVLETNPLNDVDLSESEQIIKDKLVSELEFFPQLPPKKSTINNLKIDTE